MFLIKRISNDWSKNIVITMLLLLPVTEVILHINQAIKCAPAYFPDYCSFLSCNTVGVRHALQSIYLWLLPLYLLFIFSNDCIWDFESGYINVLQSKMSKKTYIIKNMRKSFWGASGIVFGGLILNLITVHIIFYGATGDKYGEDFTTDAFGMFEMDHRLITNIIFILICSVVAGIVSMAGTMLSITVKNIKIVYSCIFVLWLLLVLKRKSIVLLFQPYSEYYLDTLVPLLVEVILLFGMISLICYLKETRFEKKSI